MRTARRLTAVACLMLAACRLEHAESGRPPGAPTAVDSLASIEQDSSLTAAVQSLLRTYYDRMSARDWRAVRAAFWPGGTVASKFRAPGERVERVAVQSVDEFVRRTADGPGRLAIFNERPLHVHVTGYGEVADAWVVHEGRWGKTRDSLRVVRGVDAFHLFRDRGVWRIVGLSATAELPGRQLTLPARRAATPGPAVPRSSP